MNEVISIHYRLTVDEYLNGWRSNFRHRVPPVFRWAIWLLAPILIIVGAFLLMGSQLFFLGVFLLLIGIYIPIIFLVINPWLARRHFAKHPDRDAEIEWRISADSIHVRGKHGNSDFTWQALTKVVQAPTGFLFYITEHICHWLPRHGFTNDTDFDRLSHLAQQHAIKFHRNA